MEPDVASVIIVGSGNAGLSAALAAAESGADHVVVLERAPPPWAGGNTAFTAGAYRTAFAGLSDVLPLVDNADASTAGRIDMQPYTAQDFLDDLNRVTDGRADPALARALVDESNATTKWLAARGVRFQLSFNRQAYKVDGRFKFWGGMVLAVKDGGKGLVQQLLGAAKQAGVEVRYESEVVELLGDSEVGIQGVTVRRADGTEYRLDALGGVVLAAGGFEASASLRTQHLGPEWEGAYVRGSPYNTGSVLTLALNLGAKAAGDWGSCHATCWDANAPRDRGDLALTNQFTKSGYPLGVTMNAQGNRFVDEGVDFRNYTYAKFGRAILQQPGGVAFQVWDADGAAWLREEEYAEGVVERVAADSISALAAKLHSRGLEDVQAFERTLADYNEAVQQHRAEHADLKFDPAVKDGLSTRSSAGGVSPDKTNWALPITKPPFLAVKVACGITFTFGGLAVDPHSAAVLAEQSGRPIPGLFCAGEMLGGLFHGNYPGGSGLTAGAVFGRKAGAAAASRPREG